ncbi:hypothetical protein [Acetobacter thailandicus]|uniref:hypothetical protein n=1 Tax=Acetobacter thailandicus TaxID=1502842 RepID=UPI001BA9367A|nr:hypothetical protein [Acetobacter thailandicus]MBS0961357.1 hypothetical protein [Acetobacter thailandicus]
MLTVSEYEFQNDPYLASLLASQMVDDNIGLTDGAETFNAAWLDPRHPGVRANPILLARSLEARYREAFYRDAIQTGHVEVFNGRPFYRSKLGMPQFAGLVLEAHVVRHLAENRHALQVAITWCSRRAGVFPSFKFVNKYLPVGTGLKNTKLEHKRWFDSSDPHFDIMFFKKVPPAERRMNPLLPALQPLTIEGTTIPAGIQVKAITCNEEEQIVTPLIDGTYSHVLTLLQHANGVHSYNECLRLLGIARQSGRINHEKYLQLKGAVFCPQQLSMDQYNINYFYEYIAQWYRGQVPPVADIQEGMIAEVKKAMCTSSLLVPSTEIITTVPTDLPTCF